MKDAYLRDKRDFLCHALKDEPTKKARLNADEQKKLDEMISQISKRIAKKNPSANEGDVESPKVKKKSDELETKSKSEPEKDDVIKLPELSGLEEIEELDESEEMEDPENIDELVEEQNMDSGGMDLEK